MIWLELGIKMFSHIYHHIDNLTGITVYVIMLHEANQGFTRALSLLLSADLGWFWPCHVPPWPTPVTRNFGFQCRISRVALNLTFLCHFPDIIRNESTKLRINYLANIHLFISNCNKTTIISPISQRSLIITG